mgnify:CR=1 FL=1
MKKEVFKINDHGYIIEKQIANFDKEGECLDELQDDIITIQPPNGLYRAKWTGSKWIEDMTQKEIDELNNKPNVPTEKERIDMLENMILLMMEG